MADHPGLVATLAYDGLCTFEFGIAAEVFALPRPEFTFPWYRFAVAGIEPGPFRAMGGVRVMADGGLDLLAQARTIVIPGWRDPAERPPETVLEALRAAAEGGTRVLSICSGVFVLAAAGLLKGRRATTHQRHMPLLMRLYPSIEVVPNVLYVDQGSIITSAGSAAGLDACLHLVRRDFGTAVAHAVARRLVVAGHREGERPQMLPQPGPPARRDRFDDALDHARVHLDRPLSIPDLARIAAMSERTFLRHFRARFGTTPKTWLLAERTGRAQELLETSPASLEEIAAACGFQSLESFRAAFRTYAGLPPGAYRTMRRMDGRLQAHNPSQPEASAGSGP